MQIKPPYRPSWRSVTLAAAIGILWALPHLQEALSSLAWLTPALVVTAGGAGSRLNRFQMGYVIGLYFNLVGLYWLLNIPVLGGAILGWLALSAFCAFYPAMWVVFCWRMLPSAPAEVTQTPPLRQLIHRLSLLSWPQRQLWALAAAIAWTAMEVLQAHVLTGFPWNFLGISQAQLLPLTQIASLTGVYGVSFVIAYFSLSLLLAAVRIAYQPGKPMDWSRDLAPALTVLIGTVVWGFQSIPQGSRSPDDASLRLALIQPSVTQTVIWEGRDKEERFAELLELSDAALAFQPDLLVWPESGLPSNLPNPQRVREFVRKHQTPLVFNEVDYDSNPSGDPPPFYNAAFMMNAQGELADRARKHHLVMFGEYTPFSRQFPALDRLSPIGSSFTAGESVGSLALPDSAVTMGILICFEDAFPRLGRAAAANHPDFLLNLTNDAWFGQSQAQWQHARAASFRAIENRLPLVRCSNNGITCWFDPYGRWHLGDIEQASDVYEKGFKIVELPLTRSAAIGPTRFTRDGNLFGWLCVSITAALLLVRELFRIRGSNHDSNFDTDLVRDSL